jgi:hypothetical protein
MRKSGVKLSLVCLALAIGFGGLSTRSWAGHYDRLTEDQKRIVQSGRQVLLFEEVRDEMWPKTISYQRVEATPEQAMAVIIDFARHKEFVHRVSDSIVHNTSDSSIKTVDYKLNLPEVLAPFFNPNYTVQEKLISLRDGNYQIDWQLVKSSSIERLKGTSWIEALPGGGTLLVYENFISPSVQNFILKRVLRSSPVVAAIKRGGGETLQSIVDRIHQERTENLALLEQQIERLHKDLD